MIAATVDKYKVAYKYAEFNYRKSYGKNFIKKQLNLLQ